MIEESKNEILVITGASVPNDEDLHRRGGGILRKLPEIKSVDVSTLQTQVNIFLQQLNVVMSETPEKVGEFTLAEFEVTAGIVIQGKGQIGIAILGQAELSGQINAGLKFVFKRA